MTRWVAVVSSVLLAGCTTAKGTDLSLPTTPASDMTAVRELPECGIKRLLPQDQAGALPGADMFPPRLAGKGQATQILPGRDAEDRTRCGAALKESFGCEDETTWGAPDPGEFMKTFRVARARAVLGASPAVSGPTVVSPEADGPERRFSYAEYVLPPGDPEGAVDFLRGAFTQCAGADPQSPVGEPDVELRTAVLTHAGGITDAAMLVHRQRLAMVTLTADGYRWSPLERAHAWTVAARHLRSASN
jgi:hypothetical protein